MTQFSNSARSGKKMAIIAGYFENEAYGLLGPQMAATIIQDHAPYECIVIAVTRKYDSAALKKNLANYFGTARPLVANPRSFVCRPEWQRHIKSVQCLEP